MQSKIGRFSIGGRRLALAATLAAVRLPGSLAATAPDVQVLGHADPAAILHFHLALRPRETGELAARLAQGRRTSPQEMRARFFPAQADYDAVVAWARQAGLEIERTTPTRLVVAVRGTAQAIARALDVDLERVRSEGADYVSAVSAPAVPAELARVLVGVNGLQPHLHYHTYHIRGQRSRANSGYTPAGIKQAYSATGLSQTGAGTTTAIIIDTFPNTSDLTTYWSDTGTAQSLSNITFIAASLGTLPAPSGEESIDTELSSALAPASHVRVYATATLQNAAVDNGYEAVILDATNGVQIDQVSISLGECEASVSQSQALTDLYYHEILTSLGASVLVATGDSGSKECGANGGNEPSFDSTSPYVTGVGGTTLTLSKAGKATETAWSGSGGGLSTLFNKPSYQSATSYKVRTVPDVAAIGDPNTGVAIVLNGNVVVYGGTSVATPIWAGLMALVNQARATAGKPTLGLLNTLVYPLLSTANIRDIKSGSNGGYTAKAGYDLVTGIGSPLMNKLLPTLVSK
jgi:kumamolisin